MPVQTQSCPWWFYIVDRVIAKAVRLFLWVKWSLKGIRFLVCFVYAAVESAYPEIAFAVDERVDLIGADGGCWRYAGSGAVVGRRIKPIQPQP